jgi:hypothetical protein
MQKEATVFIICILALFADVLCLWQILILWQSEKFFNESFGGTIIVSLVLSALCLLWFSYVLLRKIIDRAID